MLRVGAAEVDISPRCPVNLAGSFEVRRAAEVHDPLFATSTVVESAGNQLVLISCDLLFVSDEQNDELRERTSKKTGIPSRNILISCTHTHNGPSMFPLFPLLPVDDKVVEDIKGKIVESASLAVQKKEPARMGYSRSLAEKAAFNRRYIMSDGKSFMHPDKRGPDSDRIAPEGPADPELQLVWFEDPSGNYTSVIVNFSAHATCNFYEHVISADYPGVVRSTIQAALGRVPVLYLQGASGNTSPVNQEDARVICQGLEGAKRVGRILGGEVIKLLAENYPRDKDDPLITIASKTLSIPVRSITEEEVKKAKKELAETPRTEQDYTDMRAMAKYYYNYWTVEMSEGPGRRDVYPVQISVVKLDDVAIVTCPAELFVEYQLEIKKRSPFPNTMVVELTNGYSGYILTKLALTMGSYEATRAWSSKLVPEGGSAIVESALEMMREMKRIDAG